LISLGELQLKSLRKERHSPVRAERIFHGR
jgi:hypothetical protein